MKTEFKAGDTITFICTKNEARGVTIGKNYKVLRIDRYDDPIIVNDNGDEVGYLSERFVKFDFNKQIELAQSLIGKSVKTLSDGEIFIPTTWGIANQYTNNIDVEEGENVVYVESEDFVARIDDIQIMNNVLQLTPDYNALIERDCVKVGCQTIPIEKVQEIIKIWTNLYA